MKKVLSFFFSLFLAANVLSINAITDRQIEFAEKISDIFQAYRNGNLDEIKSNLKNELLEVVKPEFEAAKKNVKRGKVLIEVILSDASFHIILSDLKSDIFGQLEDKQVCYIELKPDIFLVDLQEDSFSEILEAVIESYSRKQAIALQEEKKSKPQVAARTRRRCCSNLFKFLFASKKAI